MDTLYNETLMSSQYVCVHISVYLDFFGVITFSLNVCSCCRNSTHFQCSKQLQPDVLRSVWSRPEWILLSERPPQLNLSSFGCGTRRPENDPSVVLSRVLVSQRSDRSQTQSTFGSEPRSIQILRFS